MAPPLRWWGWGDRDVEVPQGLIELLDEEVGAAATLSRRVPALTDVVLPEPVMGQGLRTALVGAVGAAHVTATPEARIRHAAGRSYLDLLRLRSGRLDDAPDAVVRPRSAAEIESVIRACAEHACAVVPFGGGTSVVGGVAPWRGRCESVIALDLGRLDGVIDLDATSRLATVQAGMRGPAVERELGKSGLTLGHFPQSYEYATIGGCAATRSAGQASTGFGRFDEMVRGLRLTTPSGELVVRAQPATAAGPSLLQVALGSEGTLGVITEVTARVRERPALRHYAGWSLPDLESGVAALRQLAQSERLPDVARLSDAEETRVGLAMAGGGLATSVGRRYLSVRGHGRGCLLVLGWEGDGAAVGTRARLSSPALRRHGALALGAAPGRAWMRGRFAGPYLRDALLDRGVLVETLETAASWSRVVAVRGAVGDAVRRALDAGGTPALVGCHISHVYPDGASLYFTVLARRQRGREIEQWLEAKRAATEALLAAGATLTHHHAVGMEHAGWIDREAGATGLRALRALRTELDPAGVMNPGKLTG